MRSRHPWWLPLAAGFGAAFVRALAATWRYTVSDAPEYSAALARGERFVYAFWHSGLLPLAVFHRHEGAAVLVSRHRDGELITRVLEHLGYVAARGSSTRGGEAGVRGMLSWAGQDRQLAVTPDGPRGPAEQAKPGALFLAERTGRRLVPTAVAARPVRALRSWDRFRIPWPFARVLVSHGAPFDPAAW
ncbi:MAG TPA: lysophospholipid acyltransferase family protein, partial [Planctomycetota bacterium]|nr:lysophospholipid acyltransferase family protein [Planctomycetota bacterium]